MNADVPLSRWRSRTWTRPGRCSRGSGEGRRRRRGPMRGPEEQQAKRQEEEEEEG